MTKALEYTVFWPEPLGIYKKVKNFKTAIKLARKILLDSKIGTRVEIWQERCDKSPTETIFYIEKNHKNISLPKF